MCASRVSTCDRGVWYRELDVRGTSRIVWLCFLVRESTYIRSSRGSRRRFVLITKARKIST